MPSEIPFDGPAIDPLQLDMDESVDEDARRDRQARGFLDELAKVGPFAK